MMQKLLSANAVVAGTLVLLTACTPSIKPMTAEESQRIDQLTEQMVTRCVGRYLIELPQHFAVNTQSVTEVEGVRISMSPMSRTDFESRLARHKASLEESRLPLSGYALLRAQVPVPGGVMFDQAASESSSARTGRLLEIWGWVDGFFVRASIDAVDGTFPELQANPYWRDRGTEIPTKSAHLKQIYSRLRARAESEIPTEPGFCFPGGLYEGSPSEDEQTYVPYHLEGAPDVYFMIAAKPESVKVSESLLQRSGKVEKEMAASGTTTIRKGVVRYAGHGYEEWLMRGPTPARVQGTMFGLLGNETKHGVAFPFMSVEMFNGFRTPSRERTAEESAQLQKLERASLSEAEALALWDKVAPTLRPRPGAF